MADTYPVQMPQISTASASPNPVKMNTGFLLSIKVSEVTIYLPPQDIRAGEFSSGEV